MRVTSGPLVTIGMPIYNEERFLERTLDSLRAQDYENIHILISDNASTDRSGEIGMAVASDDGRVSYSRSEANIGAAANFRRVLDMADGKYFMWAAGHDLWSKDLIRESVAALESNETASIAFATSAWIDESGEHVNRDTNYADTRNTSLFSRFFAVFWGNMHPVLGVIRLENLHRTKSIQSFAGADLVLLSELILMGDFLHTPNAAWKRRDVRAKESHTRRMRRYTGREFGQATTSLDKKFPLFRLPFALISAIWHARISALQKIFILGAMLPMLPVRYIVGRRNANRK